MLNFDPGSFKDPAGRVFHHQGYVYRTLSAQGRLTFQSARECSLITTLVNEGLLIDTELIPTAELGLSPSEAGDHVLKQRLVPFVSYAYEWSFEMLRDAALVTLRTIDRALDTGFILKDANSFNILFDGTSPKLVDVLSIEPFREGDTWAGYNQFCRFFLFPLLVAAYREIDIQAILRGSLGELTVQETARLLRPRDSVRPGVLKDVALQARLERSFAASGKSVKAESSRQRYPKALLVANVRRLRALIEGLKAPDSPSEWSAYDTSHTYSDEDRSSKRAFVEGVAAGRQWSRVADLGCNTGEYSKIVLQSATHVIALDLDARAIDRLYRSQPAAASLSPVVASLLNPTPAMGWGLRERRSLLERVHSDGFLALALIHHLRITGGVPLSAIVEQLFAIAPEGVIEWVDKDDSMVRAMLSLRPDVFADYTWPGFEAAVRKFGEIIAVQPTHSGHRRLCHVRRSQGHAPNQLEARP